MRALPLAGFLIVTGAAVGCSVLLDFDKLKNGADQGVVFNADLAGADLTGVVEDLAGADLTGVDLSGNPSGCVPAPGGPFFDPIVELDTPAYPRSLAVADVNGDGKLDLLVGTDANKVYVLFNNGNRTFSASTGFDSGCTNGYHRMLLVGDFDHDGKPDVLDGCDDFYSGGVQDEMAFLKGNGAGSFASPMSLSNRAKNPMFGLALDVDQDGTVDAVVGDVAGNGLSVYWGAASGFTTQTPTKIPTAYQPWGVSVGYLGGDNVPDLVVANGGGDVGDMAIAPGSISVVRRGRGAGNERTFTLPAADQINLMTAEPAQVGVAKLDGLGHPQLVVPEFGTTAIAIVPGLANASGGSSFGTPLTGPATYNAPRSLAIGDLDCDGLDDAVLTHFQLIADPTDYDRFEVYRGGAGSLTKVLDHAVEMTNAPGSDRVRIADLDGDGHPDIVMTLLGGTTGKYRILWGRATM